LKRFFALFAKTLAYALAAVAIVFIAVQAWFLGHVLWWNHFNPESTAFMERRLDDLRAKNPKAELKQTWVPYDRISANLKRAVVSAEDARFAEHEGFDWEGIQKAIEKNEKRGRIVAGGSTITQQLAKNLFLVPTRSWVRKGEEALITLLLEAMLDKRRIFELYLNVIEFGNGVFGAEAAARRYFGVAASQLSPEQAARLAAMAPNPRFYERRPDSPALERRIAIILARMPSAEIP